MALICNSEIDNTITRCQYPLASIVSGLTLANSSWVYRFKVTGAQDGANIMFFGQDNATATPQRIRKQSTGTDSYGIFASFGGTVRNIGTFTMTPNVQHVLVFTHDAANSLGDNKRQKVYLDGVEVLSGNFTGDMDIHPTEQFYIGQYATSVVGSNIDLEIYEHAFIESTLSAAQVALLNTSLAAMVGFGLNWKARFSFEENASGNATNGDLSLRNLENTGNATVASGTPTYNAAFDTRVWIAGKDISFDILAQESSGSSNALVQFWNGENNIVVLGDSYAQENNQARMSCAIIRTWQLSQGWMSYSTGAQNNSGTGGEIGQSTIGGTYGGGTKQARSADEALFATTIYNGIPASKTEYPAGVGFVPGTSDRTDRFTFNVKEQYALNRSFIGASTTLRSGIYHLKEATQTYVADLGAANANTGSTATITLSGDPTDGYTYHDLPSTDVTSSKQLHLYSTADWAVGLATKWMMLGGTRVYSQGTAGSEMLMTLSQESWSVTGHENQKDIAPVATKQYTISEIRGYLQSVPNKTKPLWVVFCIKQESAPPGDLRTRLFNIKNKFKAAATLEGVAWGGMILVMPWNTDPTITPGSPDNIADTRHAEGIMTYAARDALHGDTDVWAISIYALTDGIYLDGATQIAEQFAWAADNGYVAITSYDSTITDLSGKNMYDGPTNSHPADAEAAFGFAYIMNQYIKQQVELFDTPPYRVRLTTGVGVGM